MRKFVVPFLLALIAGGITFQALAADGEVVRIAREHVVLGYAPDRQTATPHRDDIGAVDTGSLADIAAATSITAVDVVGKSNLPISARFTSQSGTTCGLTVVHLFSGTAVDGTTVTNVVLGCDTFTVTSTGINGATENEWMAETTIRDTYGASHVKVFCSTAPSSGLVDVYVGSY